MRTILRQPVRLWFFLCLAIGIVAPLNSTAQPVFVVEQILVEGSERIDPVTVISYVTFDVGDQVTPADLDDSLTALFRTGLFRDVVLERQATIVIITVVENPVINRIAFEGNRSVDDELLETEIELRPRVVYTQPRVQSDVQRIVELYRRSGRFSANVEPVIIELDQNRVDLIFEIDEGSATGIERISFVGNEAFSDARLRREIATEETVWYGFLFGGNDNYDPDRLAFDEELLRRFYLSEGYADFRVISAVAELAPDQSGFFVTFTVEEGERYEFGEVDIVSRIPEVDAELLEGEIVSDSGDYYSNVAVEDSIRNLTDAAGNLQYAFVEINPIVTRNREEATIGIIYEINEGPRVFVERIEIRGNVRTIDRVIRREILLAEGDPFNATLLRRSETNIRNLGFFASVNVEVIQGSTPDRTLIIVTVQEQSTGELSLGAGFSTTDGAIGDISLRERNLLGRGQDLRLTASISQNTTEFDLSFTEPYFLDRDLAAGIDLFSITTDREDTGSFNEFTAGFGLRLGYALGPDLRQILNYRLEYEEITDSTNDLVPDGDAWISSIGQSLVYDRLDSRINPTDGYILRFSTTFAGLGGDVQYFRTTGSASYFTPVLGNEDFILNLSIEGGYITGIDQDVRVQDRFFVGGANLRGFETGGIGPRLVDTGQAVGGNQFAVATAEIEFPLGLPEELGIRGRAFTDAGYLDGVDGVDEPIFDDPAIRVAVGAGISWNSPFGPIRLDYAIPVVQEDFDRTQNFRFSFGTTF
ncbi:MAG: outer membrane protein assembly factor BamA [Pseudomonadota bacterium]